MDEGFVGWGRKPYLGPAQIATFSSRDLSRSNKYDTFWHVVSTGYFYFLFLWAIAVSDFLPLEIYKNLGPLVSSITFTVNNRADNHFYKYIYLFQILYSMTRWWFFFQTWLSVKHCHFSTKPLSTEKLYIEKIAYCIKIIEVHVVHTRCRMQSGWSIKM